MVGQSAALPNAAGNRRPHRRPQGSRRAAQALSRYPCTGKCCRTFQRRFWKVPRGSATRTQHQRQPLSLRGILRGNAQQTHWIPMSFRQRTSVSDLQPETRQREPARARTGGSPAPGEPRRTAVQRQPVQGHSQRTLQRSGHGRRNHGRGSGGQRGSQSGNAWCWWYSGMPLRESAVSRSNAG